MKVLLVEDEPALATALTEVLRAAGFLVEHTADGEIACHLGKVYSFDAAVLDLGLPKIDGVTVLKRWRDDGLALPVLVLTARARWSEKLAAFSAGADDYVTKPFEMQEVVVRLRALIRRAAGIVGAEIRSGRLRLDPERATVSVDGVPVRLTGHELRILMYLFHRRGRIVSRVDIIDHAYDRDMDRDSNVIDVLIGRIRRKIGAEHIETVRGLGYRFVAPNE